MGRKSSFAGIYLLRNIYNSKVYIGESGNVLRRLSEHRCSTNSPIYKNGASNFVPIILESEFTEPRTLDPNYRSDREEYYIRKFKANDPKHGYNIKEKQWHMKKQDWMHEDQANPKQNKIKFHKNSTKIKKSNPILMYNTIDESVMMFMGKQSCGKFLDKDRAIISRATCTGKKHEVYYFYDVDPQSRFKIAEKTLTRKINASSTNNISAKTLKQYIRGLKRVNEYCEYWKLPTINLSALGIK